MQVAFEVPSEGPKSTLADNTVAKGGARKRQGNSSTLELSAGSYLKNTAQHKLGKKHVSGPQHFPVVLFFFIWSSNSSAILRILLCAYLYFGTFYLLALYFLDLFLVVII